MPDRGENQEKERSTLASGPEPWYICGVFPHARLSSAVKANRVACTARMCARKEGFVPARQAPSTRSADRTASNR